MTHKEIVEKFGERTLTIFYNIVKEEYGSFDESLMEKDDEGFPIPNEIMAEVLNNLNQNLQKLREQPTITITKDVKDEIAQIIFDKTHRTVDWWEIMDNIAIVWDSEGYSGVVYKSKTEPEFSNFEQTDEIFNLKNGYIFCY